MTEIDKNVQKKDWLKVSPCSGVILYQWDGRSNEMLVGVTDRSDSVGPGFGISFGGHAEALQFLRQLQGSVSTIAIEAYREGEEELGARAIHKAIPQGTFEDFAQALNTFMVRVDFEGEKYVHVPTYYAYPTTMEERLLLANLQDTEERVGQIRWLTLKWRPGLTARSPMTDVWLEERGKVLNWSLFHHAHEPHCVFFTLALYAKMGRLWNDRDKAR